MCPKSILALRKTEWFRTSISVNTNDAGTLFGPDGDRITLTVALGISSGVTRFANVNVFTRDGNLIVPIGALSNAEPSKTWDLWLGNYLTGPIFFRCDGAEVTTDLYAAYARLRSEYLA